MRIDFLKTSVIFMCLCLIAGQSFAENNILQTVLDLPKLQQYYHVNELPDRKPLIVVENDHVDESFQLNKFGTQVIFMDRETILWEKSQKINEKF